MKIRNIVEFPIGREIKFLSKFITFTDMEEEHIALSFNDAHKQKCPDIRIHSECLTGDVFFSERCDCGEQLEEAVHKFGQESGLILYLRQEGRGIGLFNKIDAYELQLKGMSTYQANRHLGFDDDQRDFKVAADMLKALGVTSVNLLSNNPRKRTGLESNGINVERQTNTGVYTKQGNKKYLEAKINEGGHLIEM